MKIWITLYLALVSNLVLAAEKPLDMTIKQRVYMAATMDVLFHNIQQKYLSPQFVKALEKTFTNESDKKQFKKMVDTWPANYSEHLTYSNMMTKIRLNYMGLPFAQIDLISLKPLKVRLNNTTIAIDRDHMFASINAGVKAAGFAIPSAGKFAAHWFLPEAEAQSADGTLTAYNSLFVTLDTIGRMDPDNQPYYHASRGSEEAQDLVRGGYLLPTSDRLTWYQKLLPYQKNRSETVKCNDQSVASNLNYTGDEMASFTATRDGRITYKVTLGNDIAEQDLRGKSCAIVSHPTKQIDDSRLKPHICAYLLRVRPSLDSGMNCDQMGDKEKAMMRKALLSPPTDFDLCLDNACSDPLHLSEYSSVARMSEVCEAAQAYTQKDQAFQKTVASEVSSGTIKKVDGLWKIVDPTGLSGQQVTDLDAKITKANKANYWSDKALGGDADLSLWRASLGALGLTDCCYDVKCKESLLGDGINLAPPQSTPAAQ